MPRRQAIQFLVGIAFGAFIAFIAVQRSSASSASWALDPHFCRER